MYVTSMSVNVVALYFNLHGQLIAYYLVYLLRGFGVLAFIHTI